MVKQTFTILLLALFCLTLSASAQNRVLLRIGNDGKQETIPMRKGETAMSALNRLNSVSAPSNVTGTRDSIVNFGKNGATSFIASHQDVMFQWFDPQAGGFVREFGWKNGTDIGTITKSTIRAWNANIRLMSLPVKAQSTSGSGSAGNMGYYKKSDDGDGLKTPFADEATDPVFVGGKGDSLLVRFDPLGTEAAWLPKGWQFTLTAGAWQSFKLLDFGDTMKFNAHEPIGFTKQNDTKIGDIGGAAGDVNMLIGANSADQYPFHSIKFYEGTPTSNYGWQIRDYEWNFYVIVEYTTDRPPVITKLTKLNTTLKTTARTVTANVTDDNPGGGTAGVQSVYLYVSKNSGAYDSTAMTAAGAVYTGTIPGASPGDVITYYVKATDVNNLSSTTVKTTYSIFKGTHDYLFMWNGRGVPGVIRAKYYMLKDSITEAAWYDIWDVKSYGTDDIATLLTSYKGVIEANGDGGYANLVDLAGAWLATGTPASPKAWFFSDQDHGFISDFADTTFADTDPHAKYFGVKALINQDYPYYDAGSPGTYVSKPRQLDYVGGADSAFGFIPAALTADSATLWYNPHFEWTFEDWMDQFTPTASAVTLFKDHKTNTIVNGVRNTAADKSWATVWLAFDYTALDFLSDTSKTADKDPKYMWMFYDVANPATKFIKQTTVTGVSQQPEALVPGVFSLKQNYPNPFNPSTTINYTIGAKSHVTLKVYNVVGQEVATLVNANMNAGSYTATFAASNFSSGVYFYRLSAGSFTQTYKMVLMK